ncbi:MAG: DEAD/DEAH box helicase [Bacteroidota bacterium]
MTNFSALGLSSSLLEALDEMGFETPSKIQEQAIPLLLNEYRDFIGLAQTGTGKTAAFGLPLLERVDPMSDFTQALILAPTRELGQQIAKQLNDFSKYQDKISVQAVYGGAPIMNQIKALKRTPQVIVATPGRLVDLIKRKAVHLDQVEYVVLDEADEMLNMGFKEDLDKILSYTPDEKLTWLFSATMPNEIRDIVDRFMLDPAEVTIDSGNIVNTNIAHQYMVVRESDKTEALKRVLDFDDDLRGVVFCRTKLDTQRVATELSQDGYEAEALHGDLSQSQRDQVMRKFKSHRVKLLVSTDVAARGIDVDNLTHVIHYALPEDMAYYTHRSGRTARAGKKGISLAFISGGDFSKVRQLERRLKINMDKQLVPSAADVQHRKIMHWIEGTLAAEVSDLATEELLSKAEEAFADLDKTELIHRLISGELQKFHQQDHGRDLNQEFTKRSDRDKRNKDTHRFFINVGEIDHINKGELLRFICDQTELTKAQIGRISLQKRHSFFEVDKQYSSAVVPSFEGIDFEGRPLRVNRDDNKRKGGGNRGGDRSKRRFQRERR